MVEAMTPTELREIAERHAGCLLPSHPVAGEEAHRDRGALLALARTLAAALKRICAEQGLDQCPLCGDPECSAPLLDVLHGPKG